MNFFKILLNRDSILTIAIAMTITILTLSELNILKPLNGLIYDFLVKFTLKKSRDEIVLVEIDSSVNYRELNSKIEILNPKVIIYTIEPKGLSKDELNRVIFKNLHIQSPEYGVYRYQITENSLEKLAIEKIFGYSIEDKKFLINFNHQTQFPKINYRAILNSDIPSTTLLDKIVIVGLKENLGLYTPLSSEPISKSQFLAFSLESLIKSREVLELNLYQKTFLLFLVTILSLIINKFNSKFSNYIITTLLTLYLITTFLMLNYLSILLPIIEVILLVTTLNYLILRSEDRVKHSKADRILIDISENLRDKILPKSFYYSDKYWSDLVNMVNQTLNLTRVIFLEKIKDDHRLKEIIALNCSIDSIKEMRRDYERFPYSEAIERKSHVKIDTEKRAFLIALEDSNIEEEQYLAPLIFSNQILGFWAFGIEKQIREKIPNFDLIISNFTESISEMLYKRLEVLTPKEDKLSNILNFQNKDLIYQELQSSIKLIERRLLTLDNLINSLNINTILYDIFGKIIQINRNMSKLLQSLNLTPYSMSALEVILKLSNLSESRVKNLLQSILIDRESFMLHTDIENRSFYLHITPVTQNQDSLNFDDIYPFEVYGFLVELIDITTTIDRVNIKERVIKSVSTQIENSLESLSKELNLDSQLTPIMLNLNKLKDLSTQDILNNLNFSYPIDFQYELKMALKSIQETLLKRSIEIDIDMEVGVYLVYATPYRLSEVFLSILKLLEDDSIDEERIDILILNLDRFVSFKFKNRGFGVSAKEFEKYISNGSDSKLYRDISKSIESVKKWQGEVDAKSELGEGIEFEIKLLRFK